MGKTFGIFGGCALERPSVETLRLPTIGNRVFANPLWQSIGGAVGAGLGAFVSRSGAVPPMMSPDTPIGVFLGGLFGFVLADRLIFFIMQFLRNPQHYITTKGKRPDRPDELKQLAAAAAQCAIV